MPRPTCPSCQTPDALKVHEKKITEKRRVKFGALWIVLTVLTGGLALLTYLVTPRRSHVIAVGRYTECASCGVVS